MPKEIPKRQEHAQPDREHWHGPIAGLEDTREIYILRELTEHGFATEKIYKDSEGDTILEIRELVRSPDGEIIEGRIIRMENETLVRALLAKDERLQGLVQEHKSQDRARGLALDKKTAEVVKLMEMPPPKEGSKDN